MTDQEIIIAIAKLDGWVFGTKTEQSFADPSKQIVTPCWLDERSRPARKLKDYLASWDAIIPVIEKQPSNVRLAVYKNLKKHLFNKTNEYEALIIDVCFQEPNQLCIALLKATGEWKD